MFGRATRTLMVMAGSDFVERHAALIASHYFLPVKQSLKDLL
jgi:hypothetical protein